ncbi:MAG: hypothetical protein HY711_05180, partial [Candidatus Melainabacteria bacterium]|nr:hypothetical protein [Candidatus Melainabacteria bacterium]
MMGNKALLSITVRLWLAFLPIFSAIAATLANERPEAVPYMHLSSRSQTTISSDGQQPVWLEISLSNPTAANMQLANLAYQKVHQESKKGQNTVSPEELKELAESAGQQPVPTIQLGSKATPVSRFITFDVTDASFKSISLLVRPLASTLTSATSITLDGKTSVRLLYTLDPLSLSKLPQGTYLVQATLNTLTQPDMWQGKVSSNAITLTLTGKSSLPNNTEQNDYIAGRFYLLDQQYKRVEEVAVRLLARNPKSISAWELRGDAAYAQGQLAKAAQAYRQALKLHAEQAEDKRSGG